MSCQSEIKNDCKSDGWEENSNITFYATVTSIVKTTQAKRHTDLQKTDRQTDMSESAKLFVHYLSRN